MNDSLRKRVLTAVVGAAALLVILLFLPVWATVVVLTLMLLAGAWEWSARAPWATVSPRCSPKADSKY